MKRPAIFLLIICIVFNALLSYGAAADIPDLWAVSYTTYDVTYDAILKMYLKVINGYRTKNYGRHDLFNEHIFWDYEDTADLKEWISVVKRNVGYYVDDINQDGIDELVINSTGGFIYEVFTMDEEKVRELIRGGGRYTCQRLNNNMFYRWAHGGVSHQDYEVWQMNGTGKVKFVDGYHLRDDDGGRSASWYHSNKPVRLSDSMGTPVSMTEAEGWIKKKENSIIRKRFIPFSAYEKYQDDPWNIGVLAVNSKTTGSSKIRIRKEAKQKSKVVTTKKVGTYVKVLAKEDGYYWIQIDNKTGYVREEYLIPVSWEDREGIIPEE